MPRGGEYRDYVRVFSGDVSNDSDDEDRGVNLGSSSLYLVWKENIGKTNSIMSRMLTRLQNSRLSRFV